MRFIAQNLINTQTTSLGNPGNHIPWADRVARDWVYISQLYSNSCGLDVNEIHSAKSTTGQPREAHSLGGQGGAGLGLYSAAVLKRLWFGC